MAIIRHEKRRLDYLEPNFTITDVELTFELDDSVEYGMRIDNILREIKGENK